MTLILKGDGALIIGWTGLAYIGFNKRHGMCSPVFVLTFRLALAEILQEAKRGEEREKEFGPSGW